MQEPFHYISVLEGKLKAAISLDPILLQGPDDTSNQVWRLSLTLFYDRDPAGKISFDLQGYSREEAEALAKNIPRSAFIMREIDEYLWGESD